MHDKFINDKGLMCHRYSTLVQGWKKSFFQSPNSKEKPVVGGLRSVHSRRLGSGAGEGGGNLVLPGWEC